MTSDHVFPAATVGIEQYHWVLTGKLERVVRKRWLRKEQISRPVEVRMDMADSQGEVAGPARLSRGIQAELVDTLAAGRGIIFVFDPVGEFEQGDAFDHTFGVVKQLAQKALNNGELLDGKLPHHVAVCVAKFDEIRVLTTAEKMNLVTTDPDDKYPFFRVADSEDARDLLLQLCRVSASGNAELAVQTIEKHFHADRIRYFVTSSIGFYVDPTTDVFDPDDPQNVLYGPDEESENGSVHRRIRGPIHPINVAEPVLWLAERLTAQDGV
jgi:hypothetical protein